MQKSELLQSNRPVITVLQAGRAIAALAVVAYHAAAYSTTFVGPLPAFVGEVAARGYLGVDFFFVLSGFIIYHTNREAAGLKGWSRRYAETRLVRIFVPYLPVGIVVALAYTFLPGMSASDRDWGWFTTLTLLPSSRDAALVVAWTLRHELVFYAIFWIAFASGFPRTVLIAWSASITIAALVWPGLAGPAGQIVGRINLEFLAGICVVLLVRTRLPSSLFLTAAALLFGYYLSLGAEVEQRMIFAASLALLVIPLVRWEEAERVTAGPILVLLGNASYAIYLVHNPLMALGVRVMAFPAALTMLCLFVAGIVAGVAYHLAWELPAIKFTRRRLARFGRRSEPFGRSV